ncbi:MAG: hypothetical protein J6038_03700 [Bacilli bacterium]|nr:hypothetical protein [Bacilli bacterium]
MSWFSKKDQEQKKLEKKIAKLISQKPKQEQRPITYAVPEEMFNRLEISDKIRDFSLANDATNDPALESMETKCREILSHFATSNPYDRLFQKGPLTEKLFQFMMESLREALRWAKEGDDDAAGQAGTFCQILDDHLFTLVQLEGMDNEEDAELLEPILEKLGQVSKAWMKWKDFDLQIARSMKNGEASDSEASRTNEELYAKAKLSSLELRNLLKARREKYLPPSLSQDLQSANSKDEIEIEFDF